MTLDTNVTNPQIIRTFNKLADRFYKKHNGFYNYDKLIFRGVSYPGIITCPIHGDFEQRIAKHLSGIGCRKCANIKLSKSFSKPLADFIKESKIVHKQQYDYSKVQYINNNTPIEIICPIHGSFYPTPKNHLKGCLCPDCASTGFNSSKPAILYYLSINEGQAYKIGITNNSVASRYDTEEQSIFKVLFECVYTIGREAYIEEQRLLKEFSQYKYKGQDLLKTGNTELFIIDILNKDNYDKERN